MDVFQIEVNRSCIRSTFFLLILSFIYRLHTVRQIKFHKKKEERRDIEEVYNRKINSAKNLSHRKLVYNKYLKLCTKINVNNTTATKKKKTMNEPIFF